MIRHAKIATPAIMFIAFFAAWLPTLHWLQFYNSIENIVVETALETRRDGHWLIPRMLDEPRTRKPPLAAWVSALCVRPGTLEALASAESRETAYADLAREMRMPALLAACVTIVAAFVLGRVLAGQAVGVGAGLITATSLLFLEYARLATPDIYLALWVTCCNAMLAVAIFRGQRWLGYGAASAFLGLAMMSKGPIAVLQTLVPLAAFLGSRRMSLSATAVLPILFGFGVLVCVALPWPAWMMVEFPGIWRTWLGEIMRMDAADPRPERWYVNLHIFRHFMPWTLWMVLGVIAATASGWRRERKRAELALWLFAVPVLVMAFFPERKPRYLLPMIPPGAVLAAWAMVHVLRGGVSAGQRQACLVVHGLGVTLLLTGIAWASLPWLGWRSAGACAGVGLIVILTGLLVTRGGRVPPLLGATALAMLVFDVMLTSRLARTEAGRSDMKPLADAIIRHAPHATVHSVFPGNPPRTAPPDLSIYLNQVVKPVESVEQFVRSPADQIVVIASVHNEPLPVPPLGSVPIGAARRGDVLWHGFLLRGINSEETPE